MLVMILCVAAETQSEGECTNALRNCDINGDGDRHRHDSEMTESGQKNHSASEPSEHEHVPLV